VIRRKRGGCNPSPFFLTPFVFDPFSTCFDVTRVGSTPPNSYSTCIDATRECDGQQGGREWYDGDRERVGKAMTAKGARAYKVCPLFFSFFLQFTNVLPHPSSPSTKIMPSNGVFFMFADPQSGKGRCMRYVHYTTPCPMPNNIPIPHSIPFPPPADKPMTGWAGSRALPGIQTAACTFTTIDHNHHN